MEILSGNIHRSIRKVPRRKEREGGRDGLQAAPTMHDGQLLNIEELGEPVDKMLAT